MNKEFLLSSFISEEDFTNHVLETIKTYGETLKSINLEKFNKNVVDPIKLTFDNILFQKGIESVIVDEISRQRDKTNTNSIGYFHQNIFRYIKGCEVPKEGFDVIFTKNDGHKIYVEMKNKHNTMNSSASQKTYLNMISQLLESDSNDECYLVEAIAPHSRNIVWEIMVNKNKRYNERIRRVSIDKFYEIVTGEKNAFMLLCKQLPKTINYLCETNAINREKDTVIEELEKINPNLIKALYLIAFKTYNGFENFD